MSNERILTSIFDSFYPRCLEVTKMHYSLSRGYWDTTYIGKSYLLLKLWQFGRWTKKKRKFSSFLEPNFAAKKWHHRISKIPIAQTYFSRRFKICNLILPSLLGNGRINMYLQRFWRNFLRFSQSLNPLTEGGWVNSKSHLSHDWSTSPWNTSEKKVGKFTSKQTKKKWSFRVPE